MADLAPTDAAALYGYLLLAHLAGEITEQEFTEFGRALGAFEEGL